MYKRLVMMTLILSLVLMLPICAAPNDPEAQGAGDNLGKAPVATTVKSPAKRYAAITPSAASTTLREVLARDTTIAANDYKLFEWATDLSGAEKVSISVTTLGDPKSRLTNVQIGVAFAAPGDWYIVSDVINCNSFSLYDHGGFTVPVYGPYMKLVVMNKDTSPVSITQLAAYAVAR